MSTVNQKNSKKEGAINNGVFKILQLKSHFFTKKNFKSKVIIIFNWQ